MTYLDHAATTPVLPEVIAAMSQAMTLTGNASSLHTSGRAARRRVEESRERIADAVGARPSEIIFTSGGTESDNLAVAGMYRARVAADPSRRRILAPVIEHPAVGGGGAPPGGAPGAPRPRECMQTPWPRTSRRTRPTSPWSP